MTVGAWDRSNITTGYFFVSYMGRKDTKSWSGGDSPPQPAKIRSFSWYTTWKLVTRVSKSGKKSSRLVRVRIPVFPPLAGPKRARKEENEYDMVRTITDSQPLQLQPYYNSFEPIMGSVAWTIPQWTPQPIGANEQIQLVGKLVEKIRGTDFDLGVALGEGRESLQLIASAAIRLAKFSFFLRQRDFRGAVQALFDGSGRKPLPKHDWTKGEVYHGRREAAANFHLEVAYGWRPLVDDIYHGAEFLAHHLSFPIQTTYRVSIGHNEARSFRRDSGLYHRGQSRGIYTVRRHLIARFTEPPSQLASSGLRDPEVIAWNLLPWSFLADWVIPVSSYLTARAAAGRLSGTFITTDKNVFVAFQPDRPENAHEAPWPLPGVAVREVRLKRTLSSVLQVPYPRMKLLSDVPTWAKAANALALLVQNIRVK